MIKNQNEQKKFMNNERMRQENKMKNQIGLQSKRLAQMKIAEEQRRKIMNARKDHEEKCDMEEAQRNVKMDEVA